MNQRKINIPGKIRSLKTWQIPALVFMGFGVLSLAFSEYTRADNWALLAQICFAALAYAAYILIISSRDSAARLFTDPVVVLVAAFALYFLFGPLFIVLGEKQAVYDVLALYPTSVSDALLVMGMNLIGLATLLATVSLFPGKKMERLVDPLVTKVGALPQRMIFLFFLLAGGSALIFVISFDLDSGENAIISGTTRMLSALSSMAIMTGILYRGKGEFFLKVIAIALAIFSSLSGLLLFNKSAVLIPLLILMSAFYLRTQQKKWLVAGVVIVASFLVLLSKPVLEARTLLEVANNKNIETRIIILSMAFSGDDISADTKSAAWSRLCYIPPQVTAVKYYDDGNGGNDIELLGWVFLPRMLFPNKPIITRSGTDLNNKITGSDTSSLGIGLFISAYYNLGWSGLLIASVISGWILSTMAAFSRAALKSGSMLFLPLAQMGSYMAFRVDGHFIADYLGSFAMVVFPVLLLAFLFSVLAGKRKRFGFSK